MLFNVKLKQLPPDKHPRGGVNWNEPDRRLRSSSFLSNGHKMMLSSIKDVDLRQMMCCFATTMLHCVRKILFPKDKGAGKIVSLLPFFVTKNAPSLNYTFMRKPLDCLTKSIVWAREIMRTS